MRIDALASRAKGDAGTGLIASIAALLVFLALVLFAVQLLMSLYTRSLVTSAAHEAARVAAAGAGVDRGDPEAVAHARARGERRGRQLLGRFGDSVQMDWSASDSSTVVLRIQADAPRFLLSDLHSRLGHIDRTVRVRVEQLR